MSNSAKIKKTINYKSYIFKLYDVKVSVDKKQRNIEAFDNTGNLLWIIEEPTFGYSYFDMQIDEDNDFLEADEGTGRIYFINLSDGKIIDTKLRK